MLNIPTRATVVEKNVVATFQPSMTSFTRTQQTQRESPSQQRQTPTQTRPIMPQPRIDVPITRDMFSNPRRNIDYLQQREQLLSSSRPGGSVGGGLGGSSNNSNNDPYFPSYDPYTQYQSAWSYNNYPQQTIQPQVWQPQMQPTTPFPQQQQQQQFLPVSYNWSPQVIVEEEPPKYEIRERVTVEKQPEPAKKRKKSSWLLTLILILLGGLLLVLLLPKLSSMFG